MILYFILKKSAPQKSSLLRCILNPVLHLRPNWNYIVHSKYKNLLGQRKMGSLAVILCVSITKSESKIIKFTVGVLQLCSIQERSLVTINCSQKKPNLAKQWIFKDEKNLIYLECLYYRISDELGSHGNHCFINFKSCWFFLSFLPHEIGESKNKLPFKSETKITKLLRFWAMAHWPF